MPATQKELLIEAVNALIQKLEEKLSTLQDSSLLSSREKICYFFEKIVINPTVLISLKITALTEAKNCLERGTKGITAYKTIHEYYSCESTNFPSSEHALVFSGRTAKLMNNIYDYFEQLALYRIPKAKL